MKKSKKILSMLLALSLFLTSVQVPAFAAQPGGEAAEAKAAPEAGAPSAEISAGDASDGKASETNADPAGASDPSSANAKMAEAADAEPAQTEETAAEPEKAASADPDAGKAANAGKAADAGKPADTASEDPDAGKAANAGKPADAEKPAETFAGAESAENAGSEEAEAEEAETAAGVSLLDGEKWLEASTLGDDVTLDGNYVFREGYLDLNGHTLTINGYLLQTGGVIDVHGGKLLVTGDYRLQNRSDDGTEFSSCGGALVMTDADSYAKVGGVFYASGDYGYYDREHVWRTEPLTEGTLEIGKGLYQSGRSDSFKSSGSHRVLLSGAGTGKTVTVSFENDNSYVGILEMAEGANILWEGYFNVEKLGNDVELSTSKEEGRAFRIRSGDARMSFNGHNLTVNGNVDNLSGELYVGGAHLAGEGFDPANAGSLTINGSLLQNDGDLVVDGGEVTVTGDWRLQKRNSEGQYETAGGALVMVNESDRASVGGMLYASGDYGYYDLAHVWTTDMMTAGTLTIGKGLRQSGRNDAFKAKDDHRTVIAGAGEDHKASVFFESADSYLGILEMAEGADISWEGVFNVQKLGNNVTIKTDTAKNEGIVIYSKDDRTRFSGHCLTVNGNVKDLVGSLYVGGAHLTEDFDAANAGSLVIDGDFLHQSGDLVADGGSVTVTGDWLNKHLNNDGTYDSCDGALVMIHENDRVNVGGTFYASGDYGYYDLEHVWRTSMLTAGTLTIGRGL